jgi:hypothetical protein
VPPPQALGHEDLVDPAPLDRNLLPLVEVSLESVERPGAEGQAESLGVGQRRGDDFGALLGGIGVRPAGAGSLFQAAQSLVVEPADPGVDGGSRAALGRGDGGGFLPTGGGLDDAGPLDESSRGGAGAGQGVQGVLLVSGQGAECDRCRHGCTSVKDTPSSLQITCRMNHY